MLLSDCDDVKNIRGQANEISRLRAGNNIRCQYNMYLQQINRALYSLSNKSVKHWAVCPIGDVDDEAPLLRYVNDP